MGIKNNKFFSITYILAGAFLMASCGEDKKSGLKEEAYLLEGEIEGRDSGLVYLEAVEESVSKIDSVPLKEGRFSFKGQVEEPRWYRIRIDSSRGVNVLLSNEPVEIKAHVDSLYLAEVDGGADHETYEGYYNNEFEEVRQVAGKIYQLSDSLTQGGKITLTEEQATMMEQKWEEIDSFSFQKTTSFVDENRNSIASAMVIDDRYIQYPDPERANLLFEKLSPEVRSSYYGKKLKGALDAFAQTAIGEPAPGFEIPDTEGIPVRLSDFQGEYVLIDFWASWCAPCRKENPNLVEAYEKYNDQGFEILGISLDSRKDRDKWISAIEEDGLTWTQVSDLNGFETGVAEDYSISSIPQNFLIDPQGVIIAKNLKGEDLQERLEELFPGR